MSNYNNKLSKIFHNKDKNRLLINTLFNSSKPASIDFYKEFSSNIIKITELSRNETILYLNENADETIVSRINSEIIIPFEQEFINKILNNIDESVTEALQTLNSIKSILKENKKFPENISLDFIVESMSEVDFSNQELKKFYKILEPINDSSFTPLLNLLKVKEKESILLNESISDQNPEIKELLNGKSLNSISDDKKEKIFAYNFLSILIEKSALYIKEYKNIKDSTNSLIN